jgi:hypothetical protein
VVGKTVAGLNLFFTNIHVGRQTGFMREIRGAWFDEQNNRAARNPFSHYLHAGFPCLPGSRSSNHIYSFPHYRPENLILPNSFALSFTTPFQLLHVLFIRSSFSLSVSLSSASVLFRVSNDTTCWSRSSLTAVSCYSFVASGAVFMISAATRLGTKIRSFSSSRASSCP